MNISPKVFNSNLESLFPQNLVSIEPHILDQCCGRDMRFTNKSEIGTGCFFHWASPKKTKSKIVLEYPDWASPGPPKKVKVYILGLP